MFGSLESIEGIFLPDVFYLLNKVHWKRHISMQCSFRKINKSNTCQDRQFGSQVINPNFIIMYQTKARLMKSVALG